MFSNYLKLFQTHSLIEPEFDEVQDLDNINTPQLAKQKNDMIKKIFKQETQPNEQEVFYAINVLNVKFGDKYGLKNVVQKLYVNFLQDERKRVLMDSHYQLQPNLYKLYEPDAGSNDMFFDGNKHYEKLTLDHEVKRLKFTCEAIDTYSKRKFSQDQFKEYINPNKKWPQKLAKNKSAFFLVSAFRTVILQIEIFIALSLTVKITPMTRAEFDTIESKLLTLDPNLPDIFFENFFRAMKTVYGMKTNLLTERELILLYRQIRELVNVQKVIKDTNTKRTKHDELYKRWTPQMSVSLMKFYLEDPQISICSQKMQKRYSKIADLIDPYLINLRMQILFRAAIKWIIIVATQSRYQNPLEFREQDRAIITRGPELQFARYELVRLYCKRYSYEDQPIEQREFWKRELYEHAFKVIEVVEEGLMRFKKRKNKPSGELFKDKPSDAQEQVRRKMKQAQFEKYRQQVKQRYAIYKKQLQRQQNAEAKMQLERKIQKTTRTRTQNQNHRADSLQ